jgi:hypothetical protein
MSVAWSASFVALWQAVSTRALFALSSEVHGQLAPLPRNASIEGSATS